MYDYDAIVIGAGLGGLSTGALLAKNGFKTLICEYMNRVGGCCNSYDHQGFRSDIGPSIVEFKFVFEELFRRLGRNLSDYIDFIEVDPVYGFVTADGRRFTYPASSEGTKEVMATFSPEDARAWDRFAKTGEGVMKHLFLKTMTKEMTTLWDMMKFGMTTPALIKYMGYMYMNFESTIKHFFKSEAVLASMGMHAYFVGLPPAICPGYIAFLCYTDHQGIYYPRGGMASIPQGIAKVYQEYGGETRLNTRVTKVLVEKGKAQGVELDDGTRITSRLVVSNINAKSLYLDLVGRENLPRWAVKAMESYAYSFANPNIMLGLDSAPDLESHHTVCYSTLEDMNRCWFEDYTKGKIPERGFMLISWPTKEDPSLAPEGCHTLNLVTLAPYDLAQGDWDQIKEQYMEMHIESMERNFGLRLKDHIVTAHVNTPKDFERMMLQPKGAIYGLQFDHMSSLIFRPRIRSRAIKGLYLAGASTHQGGGTPTVTASGIIAGSLITSDFS